MTQPRTVLLSPVDAWFFRDGRPYNEGEANQTDVLSQFPPPATTLIGAIRAALARERGWNGMGRWDASLNSVLGNGFDSLGPLTFQGPQLVRKKPDGVIESLFAMPHHVLGVSDTNAAKPCWQPACLLTPGVEVACDLGSIRLPVKSAVREPNAESPGLKEATSQWVTADGLTQILSGALPQRDQVVASQDLWQPEARVGLKRSREKRTTEQGGLYSPRFVRLTRGTSLAITVAGLPDDWHVPELLALGGEGRMADCRSVAAMKLPDAPVDAIRESSQMTVTLITPLILSDSSGGIPFQVKMPQPNQPFFDWHGTNGVSACVGKPQSLGGWNSLDRRPIDLRPVLPAGSTWFLEVADRSSMDAILVQHGQSVGEKRSYGFGQIVLGAWPKHSGDTSR